MALAQHLQPAAPGGEAKTTLSDRRLDGKVALITGGSRGLGLLLARELGRAGCRLGVCARTAADLEWAQGRLGTEGISVFAEPCDVSKRDDVERFVASVQAKLGPVDVLVNNAGVMDVGPLEHMRLDDFERAMGVMFWGTVYPTLALYPGMVERRAGRIVNITSIGGKISVPHMLPYGCAKFAAVGFSEGLRAELGRYGVQVLTVVPGLMRTGSHVNASVRSRQEAEMLWFGLGASLPLISMDAERAARQIVRAMVRGQSEVILSWPAKLLHLVHGVLPGPTAALLSLVNQAVLPAPGGAGPASARAGDVQERIHSRVLDLVTGWGRAAADRFQPGGVSRRGPTS